MVVPSFNLSILGVISLTKNKKHEMILELRTKFKMLNKLVDLLEEQEIKLLNEELDQIKKRILEKI
jgi:hypothetical protein